MKETIADSHVHDGHRQRMRAKLLSHGQKIFDTYELLEMLLYYVVPYKDTNPISKRLLAAFGGLDGVLSAKSEELVEVNGVGRVAADFLTRVGRTRELLGVEVIPFEGTDFSDYSAVGEYLVEYFKDSKNCGVAAMFFDSNMHLLGIEKMYDLDFSSGGVKSGRFLDEAIRKRATVVISAHLHPHGPFYPTPGDSATNSLLTDDLAMAGIVHAEHYIISGGNYAGISSLKNFSRKFSQFPALDMFVKTKAVALSGVNGEKPQMEQISEVRLGASGDDEKVSFIRELFAFASKKSETLIEELLKKYRTLEGAMTASVQELFEIGGENLACYVKLLAYVSSRRVLDRISNAKTALTPLEISAYLKALYLGVSVEVAYLLVFDGSGRLVDTAMIGEGSVNSTEILPRKALEVALGNSAKSVILAHNHPFGTPDASSEDLKLTNTMSKVFSTCGIELQGHYIVAGQCCNAIVVKNEI